MSFPYVCQQRNNPDGCSITREGFGELVIGMEVVQTRKILDAVGWCKGSTAEGDHLRCERGEETIKFSLSVSQYSVTMEMCKARTWFQYTRASYMSIAQVRDNLCLSYYFPAIDCRFQKWEGSSILWWSWNVLDYNMGILVSNVSLCVCFRGILFTWGN